MRNTTAFTFLLIIATFSQCKSKKEMNNSKPVDTVSSTEAVQLNPSQALIAVIPVSSVLEDGKQIIEAEFVALKQQSFGFNTYLNSGDLISIQANGEVQLTIGSEQMLVVEETGPSSNGNKPLLRLIKQVN